MSSSQKGREVGNILLFPGSNFSTGREGSLKGYELILMKSLPFKVQACVRHLIYISIQLTLEQHGG